jgi:hypothetical protein
LTILNDPNLERLLDRLHDASDAQTSAIREHRAERDRAGCAPEDQAALTKTFLADKLYVLIPGEVARESGMMSPANPI